MHDESILFTLFLIFTGAALLATISLYARQSLLVVYIVLGILLGPSGLSLVTDSNLIKEIAHIGIIFLLFLLGLNLPPNKLIHLVQKTTIVTSISCLLFAFIGVFIAWIFGFDIVESLLIGLAMMFSSTIIGLKLLPTTVLHHKRLGEIIISILLLQDLIAIIVLLLIEAGDHRSFPIMNILLLGFALIGLILFSYLFNRFILIRFMERFDKIPEYLFLLTIGWCLGIAQLAHYLGLSYEIGAFIAGISLALSQITLFIAEILKPLRDFFLILFFFSIGASFNLQSAQSVLLPAFVLAILLLSLKPLIFSWLLRRSGENAGNSMEIGTRLGQASEFSILIAMLALQSQLIGENAAYLIQVSTLITLIGSSYLIVLLYPTPMAVSDKLRRD